MTFPRDDIYDIILQTHDYMVSRGYDIPEAIKRRDPKEPGRREKTQAEDRLFALTMRHYRRSKAKLRKYFEGQFPQRKVLETVDLVDLFGDEKFEAELLLWLNQSVDGGITLFEVETNFGLGGQINAAAAEWARARQVQLLQWFSTHEADVISKAISSFVETPGMTIGDVTKLINARIYDEPRALRIAVSEVTNAYSGADKIAGEQMQAEYPHIPVYKTWWTNADGLVCFICGPLHGVSIPIKEMFMNVATSEAEFEGPPGHVAECRCWRSSTTRIDLVGEGAEVSPAEPMAWKPSMTKQEAEQWAANSKYTNNVYHVTSINNANSITSSGFDLTKQKFGRAFGDGVYVGTEAKTNVQYINWYEALGENAETLNLKINVQNILEVNADEFGWNAKLGILERAGVRDPASELMRRGWNTGNADDLAEAISVILPEYGYDALKISASKDLSLIGGNQMIIFDPRRVTVIK